jgi:glycerophosphoryl diester phosphodiesterase
LAAEPPYRHTVLRIAHRGLPRVAHENSLASFALALDAGADGLELDVHATADGVVVIHHDPVLPDGSEIAALPFAELQQHEAAPGVAVPTLAELCELVGDRATLFVEVKGSGIEQAVLTVLQQYQTPRAIHSFDHALIARVHALDPAMRLGILFERDPLEIERSMMVAGALDVWPQWQLVSATLVQRVHEAGGRVIPWTVNSRATAQRLTALGVDALCGDDVRLL